MVCHLCGSQAQKIFERLGTLQQGDRIRAEVESL